MGLGKRYKHSLILYGLLCGHNRYQARGQMTVTQLILSVLGAKLDAVDGLKSETWYAFQSRVDMIGRTNRTRISIILFSGGPVPPDPAGCVFSTNVKGFLKEHVDLKGKIQSVLPPPRRRGGGGVVAQISG